jgi:hypothetical protein
MATNYQFRVYMNYDVRPSDDWTTTFEYANLPDDISSGIITTTADGCVAAIQQCLLGNAIIDRVVVSTWQPDSTPYDPETVRTISYGVFGDVEFTLTDPVDDTLCWFIRRNVETGRTGKIQLRGTILVDQLVSTSGAWQFSTGDGGDFDDKADVMWLALSNDNSPSLIGVALLSTTYPATEAGEKQVPIKVYAAEPTTRLLTGLTSVGPKERQERQ